MSISAIQGQLTNSTGGLQKKKMAHSTSLAKDLTTDSFSKEKANNISFKGSDGAAKGGLLGIIGIAAIVASGGLLTPLVGVIAVATIASAAAAGSKIEDATKGK